MRSAQPAKVAKAAANAPPPTRVPAIPQADVVGRLAALKIAPTPDLKQQWRELFAAEPPLYNRRFLESRLAYRIQELAYGGLKPETIQRLQALGEQLDGGNPVLWRIRGDGKPIAGTRLVREYQGHVAAFTALGGVPQEILYDRMKTAVLGEVDARGIVYNDKLLALAGHYGFVPKACRPYRAKTKGKVERPFRYVREDFFLAGRFRNLDDLNAQFTQWLDQLANRRLHGTTGRIVIEHFAEERPRPEGCVRTWDRHRMAETRAPRIGESAWRPPRA